jgi:hypothetical protein
VDDAAILLGAASAGFPILAVCRSRTKAGPYVHDSTLGHLSPIDYEKVMAVAEAD